jgi:hypothetical protein
MSEHLSVNFSHYEHQGIDLKLEREVGGGLTLSIIRTDTQRLLTKIMLPSSTALIDRRGS